MKQERRLAGQRRVCCRVDRICDPREPVTLDKISLALQLAEEHHETF
jgi:hypothetical protein